MDAFSSKGFFLQEDQPVLLPTLWENKQGEKNSSHSTLNCSITSQDASHLASKTAILNADRGVNEQLNNMSNQVIYNLLFFYMLCCSRINVSGSSSLVSPLHIQLTLPCHSSKVTNTQCSHLFPTSPHSTCLTITHTLISLHAC